MRNVDVAIVGAGVAGLSLGLHLGALGKETIILEAEPRPAGATVMSGGVVAPQLVRTTPLGVIARLGPDQGPRYLRLLAESGRYLFDLIRSNGIDCAAATSGFLNPAPGAEAADALERLIREWAPFRRDLVLTGAEETRLLTGCEGYAACLVDPTGGGLDPVAYIQGLAACLPPAQVEVFGASPVLLVTPGGRGWTLDTALGSVSARRVVLCANGGNPGLHRRLAKTVLPLPVYQVATAPLPAAMRAAILPLGHTLTDASADVFTIRFDPDGRLITACPAVQDLTREELDRRINDRLAATLPAYRETPLAFGWKGTAWLASTLLPRIVAVEEGLFAIQACNGRGLALNTIIGREVARMLATPGGYDPAVPLEAPRPIPGYTLARHVPGLMMAGAALGRKLRRAPADRAGP